MRGRIASVVLAFVALAASAQKVKTVSGEYTLYAPETMSIDEAKRTALQRARVEALADEFGMVVNQSNTSVVTNTNGQSDTRFSSIGGSDVKGEWIQDLQEPDYEINFADHLLIVKCKVKGKAREIVTAKIQYEALPLRNGTERKFSAHDFRNGDDMFLYFNSPANGYLAVFLLDESDQTVYSILPYRRSTDPAFPVVKDRDYVLFSLDKADADKRSEVDEYTLTCAGDREFNTLYILFSPKEFYKSKGYSSTQDNLPDNIPFTEFRSWMGKLLAGHPEIQLSQISLTVSP